MIRMTVISGIFLLGEMVLERCYLVKLEERRKRKKAVLAVLFIYYAVMLMNLTFLERTQTVTDYNIVPFRTIGTVLLSGNVYAIVINIFGNFFIFMPLQFFLIELFEIRKIKQNFLVCFTITFVIEIVQYIFKVGMLDVNDILLCVAGMMSFYYFYGNVSWKKQKTGDVDESRTKWKNGQGKLQKKVKKSVGLGICVFLTLLLVSQLHYEKRIQKFVLRNEEELQSLQKLPGSGTKGKTTYV